MSTKRKSPLSTPKPAKRERKAIDLDTKMKVIKQYEGLKKVNMIARELQLSHSAQPNVDTDARYENVNIRKIKKEKKMILSGEYEKVAKLMMKI